MTRYLVQIYNIRICYPDREILLLDEDASGAFRHEKLDPKFAAAHAYSVYETLYMPIGSVFGANGSLHN